MPTYTYKREDGSVFEIEQRITADALETCPTTGQAVTRVITGGSGLVFKGSGFYLTDYARQKTSGGPASDNGESKSAGKKDGKDSAAKKAETSESKATSSSSSDSKGSSASKGSSGSNGSSGSKDK